MSQQSGEILHDFRKLLECIIHNYSISISKLVEKLSDMFSKCH